jgi:D-alanyl-lipoteichoic acid acyltransferase DltB (MBOAT superfamily)
LTLPHPAVLDLYKPAFWLTALAAFVILVPLQGARLRSWARAAVNLGFLWLLLRYFAVVVVAGVVIAWVLFQLTSRPKVGGWAVAVTMLVTLALFLIHKLPPLSPEAQASEAAPIVPALLVRWQQAREVLSDLGINAVLAAIGFSYIALRVVDVSRAIADGRHPPPDLAATINYLLPFHMLAAGPIQSYDEFVQQSAVPPPLGASAALAAFERIAGGLFKKFVLANTIDQLFLTQFRSGGAYFLLEVQLNYLWLYLDFSAYSDIAVGVGKLLGVATPENFNRPYLARNVIDFWERWHISLSQWIRRHIFIPVQLTLMRRTGGRWPLLTGSVAFAAAFLLCGLWHAVSLRWLIWGGLQAVGLIICNLYRGFLTWRLGRSGVKVYNANLWLRLVAVFLTFEFAAFSLVVVRGAAFERWR